MAYRSREDCEREAERLGIDWKEMSWPELQRAVNIMLEEKGCAPMNFTPLTKMNLKKDHADE